VPHYNVNTYALIEEFDNLLRFRLRAITITSSILKKEIIIHRLGDEGKPVNRSLV